MLKKIIYPFLKKNVVMIKKIIIIVGLGVLALVLIFCSAGRRQQTAIPEKQVIVTNISGSGSSLEIEFIKGKKHNHPVMAVWIEDTSGQYIQTLYVAMSIAKGVFGHGDTSKGMWQPGRIRRPASLPYWAHKRNIQAQDGLFIPDETTPVADAYTAATPAGNFLLSTRADAPVMRFNIFFEINQPWDWNSFWHNNKYPGDNDYKTSCQPALVYSAAIDLNSPAKEYPLKLIGHSHYSGKDGSLNRDLSTITTALEICSSIRVLIK